VVRVQWRALVLPVSNLQTLLPESDNMNNLSHISTYVGNVGSLTAHSV
jgi:hypothetical protein